MAPQAKIPAGIDSQGGNNGWVIYTWFVAAFALDGFVD
jgi:hypothetical protein